MAVWDATALSVTSLLGSVSAIANLDQSSILSTCVILLFFTLLVLALYPCQRRPLPSHVQRLNSLAYTYSATAVVKAPQSTYLEFRSPRRRTEEVEPTVLKDFSPAKSQTEPRNPDVLEYQARARGLVRLRPAPVLRREAVPAKSDSKANIDSSLPADARKSPAEGNIVDASCLEGDAAAQRPTADPLGVPTTRTRRTSHAVSPVMVTFPQSSAPSTSASGPSSALCRPDIPPSRSPHRDAPSSRSTTHISITKSPADQQGLQQAVSPAVDDVHPLEYDVLSAEAIRKLYRDTRPCGTIGTNADAITVYVYFWKSQSRRPIMSPPDLSDRPDLVEGDVFVHYSAEMIQPWLWEAVTARWVPTFVGQARSDGRVFAFTESKHLPSWLDRGWFETRRAQDRV